MYPPPHRKMKTGDTRKRVGTTRMYPPPPHMTNMYPPPHRKMKTGDTRKRGIMEGKGTHT
jgi:hypothetical protein